MSASGASWLSVPKDSLFGPSNLPYCAFTGGGRARVGVRLGDNVVDLEAVARAGLFDGHVTDATAVFGAPVLNPFLRRGRTAWSAARNRISELLDAANHEMRDAGIADRAVIPLAGVRTKLPFEVGDYVDFYSSLEHATNLGRMLRPGGDPLLPNYRWIPIGYHGRAGTVVIDGTPIVRPSGQRKAPDAEQPEFGRSRMLDFELEIGFVTSDGPPLGTPIPVARARDYIFGVLLLNDWSARDVQAWEYQPLGPFLSKSFATSVAPWVVTLDALAPYAVPGPVQEPPPLAYLANDGPQNYAINLEVELASSQMRLGGRGPSVITRTNFSGMYWSMVQQLAHATSNGASIRAGDLFASGTISGAEPGSYGSMIELTRRGAQPLELPDGTHRSFLEDGDSVTMRGWCGAGKNRVGLGEVRGTIDPAR